MLTIDTTKPLSQLISDIRGQLIDARSDLYVATQAYGQKDRFIHVDGLLTCGVGTLSNLLKEIIENEVKIADRELGRSLSFLVRGIGLDSCPCCFVCGKPQHLLHNISAFVASKEEGEEIVRWFMLPDQDCARLDFRPSEPNWIQVKVGVCTEHLPALEWLSKRVRENHGRIRQCDIMEARRFAVEPAVVAVG